jgi:hypothetical protein
METWKKEEITLLESDIAQKLLQIGYTQPQAQTRSQNRLLFTSQEAQTFSAQNTVATTNPDSSTDELEHYLNMRIRRIRLLTGLDFVGSHTDGE